jgi:hypothetical protein
MKENTDKISFYADYHFVNATSSDERYKDKIYPIVLMAVVIRVSKPRKPNTVLRSVEKSLHAKKSYGSFTSIMEEMERDMKNMKSKFKIHLPPEMEKKVKKAESEGKKVVIVSPPGHQTPILLSHEAQEFIDAKNKKA